jgi:hypothetical protein
MATLALNDTKIDNEIRDSKAIFVRSGDDVTLLPSITGGGSRQAEESGLYAPTFIPIIIIVGWGFSMVAGVYYYCVHWNFIVNALL